MYVCMRIKNDELEIICYQNWTKYHFVFFFQIIKNFVA